LIVGLVVSFISAQTHGGEIVLSGQSFDRISGPESLNPAFDQLGGQTTVSDYSGLVEVLVSGGAGLDQQAWADAFYSFDPGTNDAIGLNSNSLRLGSETRIELIPSGATFHPNSSARWEAGSVHVAELAIVYDTPSSAVSGPSLDVNSGLAPVYAPSHEYHFVMDLGSYTGTLTLGIGDGGVWDNSSDTYNITLWQVIVFRNPGDVNMDGEVNGLDVNPFLAHILLADDNRQADMNQDGVVNGLDVEPFVAAVVGGGGTLQAIPEPSTLLLAFVALGVIGAWRKWGV
jgi:hypothetical protein